MINYLKFERNGFSLLEIIVVLIIVGVLTTIAIPSFSIFIKSGRATDAQNNLLAIYAAQLNYFNNSSPAEYCVDNNCGDLSSFDCRTTAGLSSCLGISIIQNDITYSCVSTAGFTCTANVSSGSFTMTLTNATPDLSGAFNRTGRNPVCSNGTATCPQ